MRVCVCSVYVLFALYVMCCVCMHACCLACMLLLVYACYAWVCLRCVCVVCLCAICWVCMCACCLVYMLLLACACVRRSIYISSIGHTFFRPGAPVDPLPGFGKQGQWCACVACVSWVGVLRHICAVLFMWYVLFMHVCLLCGLLAIISVCVRVRRRIYIQHWTPILPAARRSYRSSARLK